MDEESLPLTPPEVVEAAKNVEFNLLPVKSKSVYETTYRRFMDHRKNNKIASFSENVLIAYFDELSRKMKSSTLWSIYSMLRTTLNVKHNVDISKYLKLRAFLKRKSVGYQPKKSKTFDRHHVQTFLLEAPDDTYLSRKVALIFGVAGACRCDELAKLKLNNIEDIGNKLLITLPDTKTNKIRTFVVTEYLDIYNKYAKLRPPGLNDERFFFKYSNGKASKQLVGIHTIGGMPQEIARYLKLPNSQEYTGHCFRRTSATLLVNSGADIITLKRHGGWRSSTVAEGYIDDSLAQKSEISNRILLDTPTSQCINNGETESIRKQEGTNFKDKSIVIENCSNFTVNIYNK